MGRLSIASSIFLAAVLVSQDALTDKGKLLVAAIMFTATLAVTSASIVYSEVYRRALTPTFFYLQSIFDLLLVTSVVHVTGASVSQFAALYILVIATASLLLPVGGGSSTRRHLEDRVKGACGPLATRKARLRGALGVVQSTSPNGRCRCTSAALAYSGTLMRQSSRKR